MRKVGKGQEGMRANTMSSDQGFLGHLCHLCSPMSVGATQAVSEIL